MLVRDTVASSPLGIETAAFVEASTLLVAHPLGDREPRGDAAHEWRIADRMISVLEMSLGEDSAVADAAGQLAADPPLLAAFFQNLDLLPAGGHRAADAIALLVVLALSRLEEMGGRPGV